MAHLETRHSGQHDIEDQHVEISAESLPQPRIPIRRRFHRVAFRTQEVREDLDDSRFIFHE